MLNEKQNSPSNINIKEPQTGNYSNFKLNKNYIINLNGISYNLMIYNNTEELLFIIEKQIEIVLYNYISKYHFKDITSILSLPPQIYDGPNKVLELFDKAYLNHKMELKLDEQEGNIFIIIKLIIGYEEIDSPIKIIKNDYDINKKFDIVLGELESFKKNILMNPKIIEIENIVKLLKETVNNELNKNKSIIEYLKTQVKTNVKKIEKNEEDLKSLQDEILSLKEEYLSGLNDNKKNSKNKNSIHLIKEKRQKENIGKSLGPKKEISYDVRKLKDSAKEEFVFSIAVDGAQKTGKTSIIEKFIENVQQQNKKSNIGGFNNYYKYVKIENSIVKLDIIDFTINDITKRGISNYKKANVIMFVYSIDDKVSFEKILTKIQLISNNNTNYFFLIGNKEDLDLRKVTSSEAKKAMEKFNIQFFMEVSAKTGFNIDYIFFEAVRLLYKNRNMNNTNTNKVFDISRNEPSMKEKISSKLKFLFLP